jgi:hypothetical protein
MHGTPTPSEAGGSTRPRPDDNSASKVAKPDFYYGDRHKLGDWLNQMNLYFLFNDINRNKTLFATTYLRGRAQHWIKPYLDKYLRQREDEEGIFADFKQFSRVIESIFGIHNSKEVAIRVIQHLTQKTSASEYAAKFQEYAQVTGWDDDALMVMFRRGLKDNVKDELMRDGRANKDLDELIRTAIDLDDKLYERRMEKRHDTRVGGSAGYVPRRSWTTKGSTSFDRGDPMELDVTHKVKKGSDQKGKDNPTKKREGLKCYACGKKGHMAKNCRSKNKVQRRQFNMTMGTGTMELGERIQLLRNLRNLLFARIRQEHTLSTEARRKGQFRKADEHDEQIAELYDRIFGLDQRVEELEKEVPPYEETPSTTMLEESDNGYCSLANERNKKKVTPQQEGHQQNESELENREMNITERFDTSQLPDDEDCEDSDTPERSEEEVLRTIPEERSSSEESSSSEEPEEDGDDENVLMHFTISGHREALQMFQEIARRYEEIFPSIDGRRLLHAENFDRMLSRLRSIFWRYPLVPNQEIHARGFIQERPPIGSLFLPGGYVAPDGTFVSQEMRNMIMRLRTQFEEIQDIQRWKRAIDHSTTGSEKTKEERRRLNADRYRRIREQCDALREHLASTTHDWQRLITNLSKN